MIWLVDANNIFMRQFFKLYVSKHLTNGGAYGFIKFLFTEELPEPKKIICCWDGGRDKRRMEIYPAYKANRNQDVEIKEEQKFQMSIAKEISEEMGIINIQIERVEADDIIASLVMKLYSKKKIAIISSDSDFWQLLEYPNINLYNPKDYKRIKTKNLPVNPEDYVFYKSIVGDTSDNIVGIKGVGPKSMQKYIELKKNNLEHPFVK
jgi:DNA polymerase I